MKTSAIEPDEILNRAQNPNNIPGIYNYCDRWCERCAFTSRCLNFDMSAVRERNLNNLDANNKQYWDEIENMFLDTLKLIQHIAAKKGWDLSKADEAMKGSEKKNEVDVKDHPVALAAKLYLKMTDEFLKSEKAFFE